jgi:hypothetical protein
MTLVFRCVWTALAGWTVLTNAAAAAADCPADHGKLRDALRSSVKLSGGPLNGGFENNEWAAVVGRDGTVCAI